MLLVGRLVVSCDDVSLSAVIERPVEVTAVTVDVTRHIVTTDGIRFSLFGGACRVMDRIMSGTALPRNEGP
jgi:hypothetical protein